jgi:hypothetical protein
MALIPRPFLFCPSCGVQHGRAREFNKFRQVGLVGRATATDVLISETLRDRAGAAFTFEPLGPLALKGFAERAPVYGVQRA